MTKEQKNEVIEALKEKFSQYNNFYVTNTESLSVDQVGKLRRICFSKNVEMKVYISFLYSLVCCACIHIL